jgi:hypothetical protein
MPGCRGNFLTFLGSAGCIWRHFRHAALSIIIDGDGALSIVIDGALDGALSIIIDGALDGALSIVIDGALDGALSRLSFMIATSILLHCDCISVLILQYLLSQLFSSQHSDLQQETIY